MQILGHKIDLACVYSECALAFCYVHGLPDVSMYNTIGQPLQLHLMVTHLATRKTNA